MIEVLCRMMGAEEAHRKIQKSQEVGKLQEEDDHQLGREVDNLA